MATHFFTSAAVNYVPKARVLARSIRRFHHEAQIHLILPDHIPPSIHPSEEPFDRIWTPADLAIPREPAWLFQHNLVELSTALKGFALVELLEQEDADQVIYFDPDIVILAPLADLLRQFETASVLLTPHVTEPDEDRGAIEDHEISTLRHGVFNLGFLGVRRSPEGLRFAGWWRDRLRDFCRDDIPGGLFTDQRWADLVPALFPDHKVLRDAAYNVCTWNLTSRHVTGSLESGLLVNDTPLVFYHFSGFDRGAQKLMLDKYGAAMPALYELREWYVKACAAAGQREFEAEPWAFGTFDDGSRILDAQRREYRRSPSLQARFPNPYATRAGDVSFREWWSLHRSEGGSNDIGEPSESGTPAQPYRIFVLADKDDLPFARESVQLIARRSSAAPADCFLVTGPASVEGLPQGWSRLVAPGEVYDDLFAAVLHEKSDRDMLMVRAGVRPPELWDLRLAWSAAQAADALTVSPLDRRLLDPEAILHADITDERLDSLCYWYRAPKDPEAAAFTPECVYVRSEAWRVAVAGSGRSSPAALSLAAERERYVHRLATHVCISGHVPLRDEHGAAHPDDRAVLRRVLGEIESIGAPESEGITPQRAAIAPVLHIMHSLGGGTEYWLRDYCAADTKREQLVLRSFGSGQHHATEWQLYRYVADRRELLRTWQAEEEPISATVSTHSGMRGILREISREYHPGRIIISSLIGHSLDAFRLGVPVILVCHDYFPFCMALNITFGGTCISCEPARLRECALHNPLNTAFPNVPPSEWLRLRRDFVEAVTTSQARFAAPSPSVIENYRNLMPELIGRFQLIPHGVSLEAGPLRLRFDSFRRLRVVIPGQLLPLKGRRLFEAMLPELISLADITLLGIGDSARDLNLAAGVRLIERYERHGLPQILAEIEPEIGLLLSPTPETFSYTLREFQVLGVPTLATRRGSFVDWIEDGITGLLASPDPTDFLDILRGLAKDKSPLRRIHDRLREQDPPRTPKGMVDDYDRLDPVKHQASSYFAGSRAPAPLPTKAVQVYWRQGESFEEFSSARVAPHGLGRQTLRVSIPPSGDPLLGLRVDFATEPSLVRLYELALHNRRGERIWGSDDDDLWESTQAHQIVPLGSDEKEGIGLALSGSDAHLILPLGNNQLRAMQNGGALVVQLSYEELTAGAGGGPIYDVLAEAMSRSRTTELAHRERVKTLEAELSSVGQNAAELESRVQALEREKAGMAASISWRLTSPLRKIKTLVRGQ